MATDTPDAEALTKRLERVEGDYRRLKRTGSALLLGVAGMGLVWPLLLARLGGWGQMAPVGATGQQARVLEAERFVLKDASGKVQAILGLWEEDFFGGGRPPGKAPRPSLRFFDPDGHEAGKFSYGDLELSWFDNKGGKRSSTYVGASIFNMERDSDERVTLASDGLRFQKGSSLSNYYQDHISIEGKSGSALLTTGSTLGGGPYFHLLSKNPSKGAASLTVTPHGSNALNLVSIHQIISGDGE